MAIAFDAATEDKTVSGNTLTYAHSCSGTDRFLAIHFTTLSNTHTVNSVTYNGVSATIVLGQITAFSTTWKHHSYYLIAPATGSNNVQIVCASINFSIRSGCMSYTGVKQTSPILDSGSDSQVSGTTLTVSLTTSASGWWIMSGANPDNAFSGTTIVTTTRCSYSGLADSFDSNGDVAAQTANAVIDHTGSRGGGAVAYVIEPEAAVVINNNPSRHIWW